MSQRIGVIFGGASTEHDISLLSAKHIASGLASAGFEVALVGISRTGVWLPYPFNCDTLDAANWEDRAMAYASEHPISFDGHVGFSPASMMSALFDGPVDVLWPAVHGINCEDGVLQGFLELTGLPYVGSGVLASSMGMDKIVTKKYCQDAGIPVVPWISVSRAMIEDCKATLQANERPILWEDIDTRLGYPCFVKPSNGGSSVGTFMVHSEDELLSALEACSDYDPMVLVERFISARELEVAVQGNDTLVVSEVGEIVKVDDIDYYDYEAKYLADNESSLEIPAQLTKEDAAMISEYATEVYRILGCQGMARVDFFRDKNDGHIYLNEINTLPGFTSISLYPVAMQKVLGGSERLFQRMIELAVKRHQERTRIQTYQGDQTNS